MGSINMASDSEGLVIRALWILFITVGAASLAAFIYATVYIWHRHRKYAHIPGPKRPSFYFGNTPDLHKIFTSGGSFSQKLLDWSLDHGHIYVIFILQKELVVAMNPEAVKELL